MNPKVLTSSLPNLLKSRNYPPKYQEMAENTRYHLLPEDNRPSMDSIIDVEERLLSPFNNELSSSRRNKEWKFTWHPLVVTRLATLCLLTPGLAFLIISQQRISIPAIVFVCVALTRTILVLFYHFIGFFVRIEIVRISTSTRSGSVLGRLNQSRIQVAFDLLIALALLITASIALQGDGHYWDTRVLQLPGCVLLLIATFFQTISAIDGGSPRRLAIKSVFTIDTTTDGDHDTELPRAYGNTSETTMTLCPPEAAAN